ncbi:hypothetical protein CBL_09071 [Carabus blaptoides fortunei]
MEQHKGKTDRTELARCTLLHFFTASHDTYITSFYNWHTTKYTELSKKYRNISVKYIDNLKQTFQVQRLNTIKGKRLADIFNLNNDPYYFNDPINTKLLYCKEYVRNRLNSRLKSLQKSFNDNVEYEMKHFIHAKLLNQSFYEKHLAMKVLEIRNQKQILINNLLLEHELLVNTIRDDYARQLYQQKHAVSLINARNNSEQNRVTELVKRLNDIKLNKNHTERYNMCSKIIDDVVDLSINISTYGRKITSDFTRLFWQQWSTSVQDMTAMVANIDSIIYINENNGQVNRLSIIEENDKYSDVELYLCLKYPWNVETDAEANNSVLCHIVQMLLLAKYPLVPPNLPRVLTASAIIGITDNRLYPELEEALKDHKISTVYMHVAINYCLNSYLQDLKRKEEYVLKEYACAEEELDEDYYTESLMPEDQIERLVKQTQTSGFFGLEFKFSPQAELGRLAYEALNAGEAIGSSLLTNILIQYLNTLDNINGWTIFNYPEVHEDAVNLELGLTGKLTNTSNGEDDHLKRVSQLSSTADASTSSVDAKSYLTSYVHVLRNSQKHCVQESLQIINTSASATDSFYSTLGCSSSLTYNTFDPQVINQTIALILTDKIFEKEICDAIVENTFKTVEQAENERRQSERTVSVDAKGKKTKDTKAKSSKKDKTSIASTRNVNDGTLQPAQPGELGWNYISLAQSVNVQILLATMWENVERTYKTSLAQLFHSQRTFNEFVLPYFLKIDVYFTNIIEKSSSNIQEHVHVFQEYYNSLPNFYREDDEFKAELHFRIDELKQKLTDACDQKRNEAETERERLVRENWFANHAISLLNVYTHVTHAELNRCVETLQFMFDYYTAMLQQTLLATKFKNPSLELFKYNDSKICPAVATYFLEPDGNLEFVDKLLNHMTTNHNTTINSYHTLAMENVTKLLAKFTVEVKPDKKKKKSIMNPLENAEFMRNIGLLKEEYQCAIKEECARVRFRLNLINSKAGSCVKELLLNGKQLFDNLSMRLMDKYQKELRNIHAICQVFADAVEWCERIEPTVVML